MIKLEKYFNKKLVGMALLIALVGTGSTLAYFIDKAEIKPHLAIQLGTLNTNITENISIEGLDIDSIKTDEFTIKNTGTLRQKLEFNFSNPLNIEQDGLDKLNYEIVFSKANGEMSKTYSGVMTDLFADSIKIVNESGERLILDKDEELTATIKIDMDKAMPYKYSNKEINFDIVVNADQINSPEQ